VHLNCPHCGDDIRADDMHLDNELAKCRGCDAVFSFAQAMDRDEDERTAAAPDRRRRRRRSEREAIGRPKNLEIRDDAGTWEVRHRWFNPVAFFLAFFCVFWDGFLVVWYTIGVTQMDEMGGMAWVMLLFPLIHVAVGVGLTWYTLALFINSTTSRHGRNDLVVRHGPLWVPGNRRIPTGDLDQLFCKQRISRGKNGTTITYELHALLKNGERIKLLTGYREIDHVLYLEQEIERRLGIRDRAMPGEAKF